MKIPTQMAEHSCKETELSFKRKEGIVVYVDDCYIYVTIFNYTLACIRTCYTHIPTETEAYISEFCTRYVNV